MIRFFALLALFVNTAFFVGVAVKLDFAVHIGVLLLALLNLAAYLALLIKGLR